MAKKQLMIILLLTPLLIQWHWFEPAAKKNRAGIDAYEKQRYDDALKLFLSGKGIKIDSDELKNNTASALFQVQKYKEALEEFSQIDPKKSKLPKAPFYYNTGNSLFKLQDFQKALESYKKAILEDPADMDAKKNYELTLKKIQEQEQKKKEDEKKKEQEQNQQQKKDDQEQQDKKDQKDEQKKDQEQQQQPQNQEQQKEMERQKYQSLLQYLNQNDKKQMEKKKRQVGAHRRNKDW